MFIKLSGFIFSETEKKFKKNEIFLDISHKHMLKLTEGKDI